MSRLERYRYNSDALNIVILIRFHGFSKFAGHLVRGRAFVMTSRVIENPVINKPYEVPARHYRFDSEGITNEIVDGRRPSEYFVPVPQTKKAGSQLQFDNTWTADRIKPNDLVNQVRSDVALWREQGYPYTTATTRRLLEFWADPYRDNPVMFCQREAVETIIYLAEAAQKAGRQYYLNALVEVNSDFNAGLPRIAVKMATGTGKTVVMAMVIAWQALNKAANQQDKRFGKRFLIVTPGITIRDRLRVLQPGDAENYYRQRDLVPSDLYGQLSEAQIVIVNYHVFLPKVTKEGQGLAATTKALLLGDRSDQVDPFKETPQQVATRVAREFGLKPGELIVINDEAHHCYQEKPVEAPDRIDEVIDTDEKDEIKSRTEEARVWFRGLQALMSKKTLGIKAIYDLSATPFFLNGSGYGSGVMFPWVVSDFSLIDAIESGIVKVPRVPVDDNTSGQSVVFRNLWDEISAELPKRVTKQAKSRDHEPQLPAQLEMALNTLYDNYEKQYTHWESNTAALGATPPVFIVVCNNTTVSKLVFDWIAGYDKVGITAEGEQAEAPVEGHLDLFTNVERGQWLREPRTILVDSAQLESGGQLSQEFRSIASREIEEFKFAYRQKFPGRDNDEIDDATLLREVMNSVGKIGKLGERIRCVVSVSMLTEGWDANTVTHILGVRAFRTPLLTEQVVGRGLRRRSYSLNADGMFDAEYAEVFGVPFAFIPASGTQKDPKPKRAPIRVWADPSRPAERIVFPRLLGYRLDMPIPDLTADVTVPECQMVISTESIPTETDISGLIGEGAKLTPLGLQGVREQEVAFHLTHALLDRHYRDPLANPRPWLFPGLLAIVKDWMHEAVEYGPRTFPGMLLLGDVRERAIEKLVKAIVADEDQKPFLLPIIDAAQPESSTDVVDFDTTRPAEPADPARSPVTHVVIDSGWEKQIAHDLDQSTLVKSFVKNDGLHFYVPYSFEGLSARYQPDFLVRLVEQPDGIDRTLIVEVSGGKKRHHSPGTVIEKAETVQSLWIPSVERHGGYGLWGFVEIKDPDSAPAQLRAAAEELISRTSSTSGDAHAAA